MAVDEVCYDNKPTINITSPLDATVATPNVLLSATCNDTRAPCASLVVNTGDIYSSPTLLASGTTSINKTVSLANYNGQQLTLNFIATDSSGQTTTVSKSVFVESSGRLTKIADVSGTIMDYSSDGRILYVDTSSGGNALKITNASGGAVTTVYDIAGFVPQYGFLTPNGTIFMEESGDVLTSHIENWSNGTLTDFGMPNSAQSLTVSGNYAIWSQGTTLLRLNLLSGVSNTVSTANVGNWNNAADSAGDVVYWATGTSGRYQIFKYNGSINTQLTNDTGLDNVYPIFDGITAVYRKQGSSTTAPFSIGMYNNTSGEIILSTNSTYEPNPVSDYKVNNGWIAYTKVGLDGIKQVWLRSPGGLNVQCTYFGTSGAPQISALSPNGEVLLSNAGLLYSYVAGTGLLSLSTSNLANTLNINNSWYAKIGRSLFSLYTGVDSIAPLVTSFSVAPNSSTSTVSVLTFSATDNVAVTGYLITESSITPYSNDTGWSAAPPALFTTTSGTGIKMLYGWAKDAAGNMSLAATATTSILGAINGDCGSSNNASFTIAPSANFCTTGTASTITGNGPWSWTCAGSNGGTTTSCSASVASSTFQVTPQIGSGFAITPASSQLIANGTTTVFTIIQNAGYGILSVSGCGGTLNGNTYTTGPVNSNCIVSVISVARTGSGSTSAPSISDALSAYQAVLGIVTLTATEKIIYDVAPLSSNGSPVGNGTIDIADVILILRRSIGIGNW